MHVYVLVSREYLHSRLCSALHCLPADYVDAMGLFKEAESLTLCYSSALKIITVVKNDKL